MENNNHPRKGSAIKVDPIKDIKDIKALKKKLAPNPVYYALFILGIETAFRAVDLLTITAGQVRGLKEMDPLTIIEKKTKKERTVNLNKECIAAIKTLLATKKYNDDDKLFTGQRGPLIVPSISRLVKQWCASLHLRGNYAAHTLRKTFGYHQRVTFGVGIAELMDVFGHSNQKITLRYLCIQPEEIKNIYANII